MKTLTAAASLLIILCWCTLSSIIHCWNDSNKYEISETENNAEECHKSPWTRQGTNKQCECGDNLRGTLHCDSKTFKTSLLTCNCLTYSEIFNKTLVGHCIFNCFFLDELYNDVGKLKNFKIYFGCSNQHTTSNRTGQNCGKCLPGHAPAVYSYLLACVECKDYKYNWLKYIAIAYLPLTLVYFIIILFRIKVTSGKLNTYILISQLIAAPINLRLLSISRDKNSIRNFNIMSSPYMIWNLDIFRSLYKPFCLHPNTTTLQTFALEYAVAVYPMVLIFITYILVRLHDNYILVVRLWKPFYWIFARIRREWNIRSSLVDAFVTFLLLSYVKIANISFDLLTPVSLYDVNGTATPNRYFYYEGTMEYFGREHLPYAILALIMLLLFNILPLVLLCLYPTSCFQHCKDYCHIHSNAVHMFIYTFQGCYKTKPYDCRYFAGIYLGFRLLNLLLFTVTTSPLYYAISGTISLFMTVLVAIVRPYDKTRYVVVDVVFLTLLTCIFLAVPAYALFHLLEPRHLGYMWYEPVYYLLILPPLYGIALLIYNLIPNKVMIKLKELVIYCKRKGNVHRIPDRLINVEDCPPLLDRK